MDGNSNTDLGGGSCTHTATEKKPWWEVDFGKIYNITGVEITNRANCCEERVKNFNISVDGLL